MEIEDIRAFLAISAQVAAAGIVIREHSREHGNPEIMGRSCVFGLGYYQRVD